MICEIIVGKALGLGLGLGLEVGLVVIVIVMYGIVGCAVSFVVVFDL